MRRPATFAPGRREACRRLALAIPAAALGCRRPATPERTLRVSLQGEPTTLDPHLQDDLITHSVLFNVYDALTVFDADMRLQPGLATDWHSRDELTWVFALRPDVRFHDGRPVTAEDVVASLERARHVAGSRTSGYLVGMRQVRMTSPTAVEIVTWRPHALLAKKLAFVAVVPRDAPQPITAPAGTGPYRLVRHDGRKVSLDRSGGYWAPAPGFAHVELTTATDGGERERSIAAGEVDVVLNLDTASVERLKGVRGIDVSTGPSLSMTYLGMRCDRGPFADVRVRRAAHLAVDRAELGHLMRRGLARPATQLVDKTVFGFDPGLPVVPRDVAAARQLLAAAGHAEGLDVTLEHRQGLDAGQLARQLGEAGFRVRATPYAWKEMLGRLTGGQTEMYLGGQLCPTGDASDILDVALHSRDETSGYGSGNYWGYANAALDALVERSSASFDQADRLALLQQAMRVAAADLPMLPLFVPYNAAAVRSDVQWHPRLDGFLRLAEARPAPA